jgi:hypothetical protein
LAPISGRWWPFPESRASEYEREKDSSAVLAAAVKNLRLIETGYQSPQLKLWTLGPDEWLLFLKLPDYAARKKPKDAPEVIQLPLLDPDENQRQEVSS